VRCSGYDWADPTAELNRWIRFDCDESERISGNKAAQHLGWTRPTFLRTWREFIGRYWEFDENGDYSESLLRQLKARKIEGDRKREADQARDRRAERKTRQEKSEKL
jgi:hypothetical protein